MVHTEDMTTTTRPAVAFRAFLPEALPVLKRAQVGAMASHLRASGYELQVRGIGRRVTVPAGMVADQGWDLADDARIVNVFRLAGCTIVPA